MEKNSRHSRRPGKAGDSVRDLLKRKESPVHIASELLEAFHSDARDLGDESQSTMEKTTIDWDDFHQS